MTPSRPFLGAAALALFATLATIPAIPSPALAGDAETAALERQAEKIMKEVEEIRGLRFSAPVKKGVQSSEELKKFLIEEMAKELPDEKARAIEKAYAKIGFVKPGFNLKRCMTEILTEQIAAFYNPERKELFLIDQEDPEQTVVMAHELTHALQDQHFDLTALEKGVADNDDRECGLKSLIEGDATVAMVAYMLKEQGIPFYDPKTLPDIGKGLKFMNDIGDALGLGGEKIKEAPKVLSENLVFSYVEGASFCQRLIKAKGDYKAVSAAFRDPPTSSEQILHPEKYLAKKRDEPIEVRLPDLVGVLGPGWTLLEKNVMGELSMQILFKERLAETRATRAAAGWGGDSWQVLQGPAGEALFVWYTAWDTERDAQEFAETYREFADRRGDGSRLEVDLGGATVTVIDGHRSFDVVERLREAFKKVTTHRGYTDAAIAATPGGPAPAPDGEKVETAKPSAASTESPFAALRAPAGYAKLEAEAPVVKAAWRGPDGAVVRVFESPATAADVMKTAKIAADEINRSRRTKDDVTVAPAKVRGQAAARVHYPSSGAAEGRVFDQWYVVAGGRQHVLAVSAPPGAIAKAVEALRAANPGLLDTDGPAQKKESEVF